MFFSYIIDSVADALSYYSRVCYDVYYSIVSVPLLGKYLATPFYYAGYYLSYISSSCRLLKNGYEDLIAEVYDRIRVVDLNIFISSLFPEWNTLRTSSISWLWGKLNNLITDFASLAQSPGLWLSNRLRETFPLLYRLSTDFRGVFVDFIFYNFGWLYQLYIDARGFAINLVLTAFPNAYSLLTEPSSYVRSVISQTLGLPSYFWYDPSRYIFDLVFNYFERSLYIVQNRVYRLAERALRGFWEGVWQ